MKKVRMAGYKKLSHGGFKFGNIGSDMSKGHAQLLVEMLDGAQRSKANKVGAHVHMYQYGTTKRRRRTAYSSKSSCPRIQSDTFSALLGRIPELTLFDLIHCIFSSCVEPCTFVYLEVEGCSLYSFRL